MRHGGERGRAACLAAIVALLAATPAGAFSAFDGKLEIHGYVASQVRTLAKNFSFDQQWDLSQWASVVNLELEAAPFPDGIGPIEILSFYARAQGRYDCVWTRACGMFPSVNTYGDRAERLPERLIDGRYAGFTGALRDRDTRLASNLDRQNFTLAYRDDPQRNLREPLNFGEMPGLISFFGNARGPNEVFERLLAPISDDPPSHYMNSILKRCLFGVTNSRGGENGSVFSFIGPWNPGCEINPVGSLRFKPNPFSREEFISILAGVDGIPMTGDECVDPAFANPPEETGCPGAPGKQKIVPTGRGTLPYRPVPFYTSIERAPRAAAQGLFLPSSALVREIQSGRLDSIDQNFSQAELEWNRGSSQQDEQELKEAYADIEMFEGRLWMRLGKQTVVWGKTELFRNTDQFNPQDFALASLPDLEESRIGLWAARATWSFYNFGKIEDVRLEVAMNIDDFEPSDLGRCGEPYTLELVCGITLGYFAHGFGGAGLAGQDKPPAPWDDASGLEVGARLEWRYGRFSFQLSNFYGYDDFPYPRRISTYERNVDPETGRPRRMADRGACTTGNEPACLGRPNGVLADSAGNPIRYADTNGDGYPNELVTRGNNFWKTGDLVIDPALQADTLANHSANQTAFAFGNTLCGAAGTNVDPSLCGFAAFNGKGGPGAIITTVAMGASAFFAGSPTAALSSASNGFQCALRIGTTEIKNPDCSVALLASIRTLNVDPGDCGKQDLSPDTVPGPCVVGGMNLGVFSDGGGGPFQNPYATNPRFRSVSLGGSLSPEQEALLGCGPFYQADCDIDGIDFLNAEASVLIQSWPGFEGTRGSVDDYDLADPSIVHPGTVGFRGGPVATFFEDGEQHQLPGSRGPGDPGYDPTQDGCTAPGAYGCNAGDTVPVDANRDGTVDISFTRVADAFVLTNPINGQLFATELSALSHNMLMAFATGGQPRSPMFPTLSEFDIFDPYGFGLNNNPASAGYGQPRPGVDPASIDGVTPVACGIRKPQLCNNVRGILAATGLRRNSVRAGGRNGFGRRDFIWHSSGEVVLDYDKRNVLGFAFDFDEERTKSNWGVEATWIGNQVFVDNDEYSGISSVDTLNLTVSIDRPTFINFLNQGRTFFFNTQWFFQYINDYGRNFYANGPLNVLGTFTAFTGYHQDRLMFYTTLVYDFNSNSGALLPSMTYRFTESFSATLGMNLFFGHEQLRDAAINELRPGLNRVGHDAYKDGVSNGLTVLRDREELNLTIRYTF